MKKMTEPSVPIEESPAVRIALAVETLGETEVVERATALLGGLNAGEEFLLTVGGKHAQGILDGAPPLYWPELWGARALLHVWNDSASYAIRAGLGNQAWRVREMCLRVIAERRLGHPDLVAELLTDEVARVRASAARTLGLIGEAGQLEALRALLKDPDIDVRRQVGAALTALKQRVESSAQ
jgi:HEAT repeat protein